MECYSHNRLLLQRDVLALRNGEAKAHYSIAQFLSKIVVSETWLTKNLYNELWGTIYSKGWGDPWHSPLRLFIYPRDSSTTLWLLHSTINTWTSTWQDVTSQCTCAHVRQNGLSKPYKTSLTLGLLWWDQLFDMLVMVEGGEMMPILVIRDGVHALHGDILLNRTLAFVAFECIGMAPPSNSSASMCMVFLGAD